MDDQNRSEYQDIQDFSDLEDDSDFDDLIPELDVSESLDHPVSIREDLIDRVFKSLSADAQRGDNQLYREDINRAYLRKQLSIDECMAVEALLHRNGYQIIEDLSELENDKDQKYQYLTEAEEKRLGRQIQLFLKLPTDTRNLDPSYVDRIQKDAAKAKSIFLATNIRFVEQLARRMGRYQHFTLEDIIQEGCIGLLHATERYDPEKGFRFKTYASWWIQQKMHRAVSDRDRTIRLPVHVQEKLAQVRRAKAKLMSKNGTPPTLEELATAMGENVEKLMKLFWYSQSTECLDADIPIGGDAGGDTNVLSFVPSEDSSAFEVLSRKQLKKSLRDVLSTLHPREELILRMRYGIDLTSDHTLESIGQKYDLTRERIRQIEAKAMRRLQHVERSDKLKDFLDD